jgi:hypothetical protein
LQHLTNQLLPKDRTTASLYNPDFALYVAASRTEVVEIEILIYRIGSVINKENRGLTFFMQKLRYKLILSYQLLYARNKSIGGFAKCPKDPEIAKRPKPNIGCAPI